MTNSKTTKRTLLGSIISIVLCFAMLLGTTFAWFTDNAATGSNVIKSGNLDVDVQYTLNGTEWFALDNADDLFQKDLWEPGHTEVVALKVTNNGSLALKYTANMNIIKENIGKTKDGKNITLSEILTVESVKLDTEADAKEAFKGENNITYTTKTSFKDADVLGTKDSDILKQGESEYVVIKVDMAETVGNEANHNGESQNIPKIEFGINVIATQFTYENDSFGNQYDKEAEYPVVNTVKVPASNPNVTKLTAGEVTVYIPANAAEGEYKLEIPSKDISDGEVEYDINLYKDGAKVSGETFDVEIYVGEFVKVTGVTHNGTSITFDYDAGTGIVSFKTDSFSPYVITYEALGENVEIEDGKIVSGIFNENPVAYDASLKEDDSEYIAVNYTQGGATKYVVSKRSETVVVAADDSYTATNDNYTPIVAGGKLYTVFQNIVANEHTTVYLLPGTYTEATTISVTSSVDIIGLGDKEAIKVVKKGVKDSSRIYAYNKGPSNRHLFNCTSSASAKPYIQVTISNLTLDATDTNNYVKYSSKNSTSTINAVDDNAAVQAIRKAKVKCYDLDIIKDTTDASSWAFYVNGNNTLDDGSKVPAYMYVENCEISGKSVVSVSGKYKFYHNNLKYNGGTTYTGSTQQKMEADDWDW